MNHKSIQLILTTCLLSSVLQLTPTSVRASAPPFESQIICTGLQGGETLTISANRRLPRGLDHVPESIDLPIQISTSRDAAPFAAVLKTSFATTMNYNSIVRDSRRRLVLAFHWDEDGRGSYQRIDGIQLLDGKCHIE